MSATLYNGSGDPSGIGVSGDYYIDEDFYRLWHKYGSTWGYITHLLRLYSLNAGSSTTSGINHHTQVVGSGADTSVALASTLTKQGDFTRITHAVTSAHKVTISGNIGSKRDGGIVNSTTFVLNFFGESVLLESDGSGGWIVVQENLVPCRHEITGPQSGSPQNCGNGNTVLTLSRSEYDYGGGNDTANNRIVIKRAGLYSITASAQLLNEVADQFAQLIIDTTRAAGNTSRYVSQYTGSNGGTLWLMNQQQIMLAVGDTVKMSIYRPGSGSKALDTAANVCPRLSVVEVL